jgi:hypothetical protein
MLNIRGKTCSLGRAFTRRARPRLLLLLHVRGPPAALPALHPVIASLDFAASVWALRGQNRGMARWRAWSRAKCLVLGALRSREGLAALRPGLAPAGPYGRRIARGEVKMRGKLEDRVSKTGLRIRRGVLRAQVSRSGAQVRGAAAYDRLGGELIIWVFR